MPEPRTRPQPCPSGRVEITGQVLKIELRPTDFGMTLKMAVRDDRGFAVWLTCPIAINRAERGDRVQFTASIQPSKDDTMFGFGKRPAKARFLETASVAAPAAQ